jgi:hypothetical protein
MTLTISPEAEEKIAAQARIHGLPLDTYAVELLEREAPQPISVSELSADELMEGVRDLAKNATAVANYPPDFFSRDVIYADHD